MVPEVPQICHASGDSHVIEHVNAVGHRFGAAQHGGGNQDLGQLPVKYYRARYYEPHSGRFISEDPTAFNGGTNFYAYAMNQPEDFVDPSGLLAELYCDKIGVSRRGWLTSPIITVTRPRHCFIRVKCRDYDRIIQLAGPPKLSDGSYGKHGVPLNTEFHPSDVANAEKFAIHSPAHMACCEFEDLLFDKFTRAVEILPEYAAYPGPNSNTFANYIITQAGGTADFPFNAYGFDFGDPIPQPVPRLPKAPTR